MKSSMSFLYLLGGEINIKSNESVESKQNTKWMVHYRLLQTYLFEVEIPLQCSFYGKKEVKDCTDDFLASFAVVDVTLLLPFARTINNKLQERISGVYATSYLCC